MVYSDRRQPSGPARPQGETRQRAVPAAGWLSSTMLDALKILALLAMTIDHVNAALLAGSMPALSLIGLVAFPVFVFAAAFGALRTRDPQRYLMRLLLCALIAQPFFWLALPVTWWHLNTVFTLLFGVACVLAWRNGYYYLAPFLLLPAYFADYSLAGAAAVAAAALILSAHHVAIRIAAAIGFFALGMNLWPTPERWLVGAGAATAAGVLLMLGRQVQPVGPRYTFYVFYPLHLAVLAALRPLWGES